MNPIIGSITGLLLLCVVVALLTWMRRMTVNSGSKVDYDWDEYSSEFEDDEDDDEAHIPAAAAAVASTAATTSVAAETSASTQEETDWVMGSDGYWWYHDKATNEWWYKDANGEIVKHP